MNEGVAAERLAVFERHRAKLFGIAYRMLGSAMDAEDVVQDASCAGSSSRVARPWSRPTRTWRR